MQMHGINKKLFELLKEFVSEYHWHLQIKALQFTFHTESYSLSESFSSGLNLQRNIFESSGTTLVKYSTQVTKKLGVTGNL